MLEGIALVEGVWLIAALAAVAAYLMLERRRWRARLTAAEESRAEAESNLRRLEARNSAILQGAVDGIITIEENGLVYTFNAAAERTFGYAADEVIGRNVNLLMPEPYRSAHDGYLTNYLRTGEAKIIGIGREVQGLRKDGSVFPMDLAVGEGRRDGRRIFAGIVRDISARKQAEEDLRSAKDEAESANLAKSKFLAAASHDLRQPVQALFFFTAALAMKLKGHPARAVLADLERSLNGLNMLLDSLLDVSKLDSGLVAPQETYFSVASLLERMENDFGPAASSKGVRLRVVPSSKIVRSDPALLSRILQNLVSNAVRYTERGKILIGCRLYGPSLRIEVWDTGIGIPFDRRQKIFEEFYQIANSERDRGQGLGLGLAIVNRLARLLHHRIDVKSELGKFSKFSVDVPLASAQPPAAAEMPTRDSAENGHLVVLIDDEAAVLKGLAMVLEQWGFDVLAAGSADEALTLLGQYKRLPHAIVADYRLREGRTGTEAIRNIRNFYADAPIPSIIITGDTAPERLREAESSGFSILHKPIQPPDLHSFLARAMARPA